MKIPGFIDLQINGFKGVDFSSDELTEENFCFACAELLKTGTAAFLPTLITTPAQLYSRNLPLIAKVIDSDRFDGRILGIHLEGPFISDAPGAVGAHNPEWTRLPDIGFFEKLQEWANGNIKLVTIAAEKQSAEKLTKYLVNSGITVSLGHQMANYNEMKRLYDAGATAVTHLGNGMPNQAPRHDNQIITALAVKKLKAMLITDGHHLPEPVIRTVFNAKDIDDIIVTSDASPIAGLTPGRYNILGNDAILEEDGLLHNPEKQCLVGSSAMMLECMNHLSSLQFLSAEELLKVGFGNPLALLGIDKNAIVSDNQVVWNENKKRFELI